jgi:hypothetical protein
VQNKQDMVADREAAAESIVARQEAAMGRTFDPAFRAEAISKLASRTLSELKAIQSQSGAALGIVPEAYGSPLSDLVFTPVTPCRIIDTRVAGGPIAAGSQRNFLAAGVGFSSQGGFNGDCGVPLGPATAVVVNLIAVNPAGGGDLRAFPFGAAVPLASVLNYANVPLLNIANDIVLKICDSTVTICAFDFTVQADVSGTDVVGDVMGYFKALPSAGRAYALVEATAPTTINPTYSKNFTSVRRPATGVYCLTAAAGISQSDSPHFVTVEWINSFGNNLAAYSVSTSFGCNPGEFGVQTYDFTGAASNNVSFRVFVP